MTPEVVLIAGGAGDIGRALTEALLRQGYRVALSDLDATRLDQAVTALDAPADRLFRQTLDVTSAEEWSAVLTELFTHWGRLDFLVNLAGVIIPGYVHDLAPDVIEQAMAVNATGAMLGTSLAAARMVPQGYGQIINVASLAGLAPVPGLALYAAGKAALRTFSLAANQDLRGSGVGVTVVCPDLVESSMLETQLRYPEAALSFSGGRALTMDQVVQTLIVAMRNKPAEMALPTRRAALARLGNAVPALQALLYPILRRQGMAYARRLRTARAQAASPPGESPRICIIGAGVSGITMGKYLLERGLAYDCYEMSDRVGGNWAFKNPNGLSSAYRSLHIDTSKERLQFDDFPMPPDTPTFPHHSHINDYLNAVVDHFGLREHIHFRTAVSHARPDQDGQWRIDLSTGIQKRYDYLIVANGHHWDPRLPDFPGHFDGPAFHSHDYIDPFDPVDLRGKRVLVVGMGNSAVDIACELSNPGLAQRLFLSTRRGAHVIPKYIFGRPVDQAVETIPWLPMGLQRTAAKIILRLAVGRMEDYGLPTPDHGLLEAHPTVSSDLLQRTGSGDIIVKPDIAQLLGDRVRFVDGSEEAVDAIIYATGYQISFPFFDSTFLQARENTLPLFKRTFVPGIDNLMFIGFAQAIPSIIEFVRLQARWAAAYLAGDYALPAPEEMRGAMARDAQRHAGHYVHSPRHTMQVDTNLFAWDLAEEWRRGSRRAGKPGGEPRWRLPALVAGMAGATWLVTSLIRRRQST